VYNECHVIYLVTQLKKPIYITTILGSEVRLGVLLIYNGLLLLCNEREIGAVLCVALESSGR
jgi:hypothetical protein